MATLRALKIQTTKGPTMILKLKSMRGIPFASRFDMQYIPVPESGCWLWVGIPATNGYGRIRLDNGKVISAHRASMLLKHGGIPVQMDVLHTCDVRTCVNPDHLYFGTDKDNTADRIKRGRGARNRDKNNGNNKYSVAICTLIKTDDKNWRGIAKTSGMSLSHAFGIRNGTKRSHI